MRTGLNAGLGFASAERLENVRRTVEVAALCHAAGLVVICALISPLAAHRQLARAIVGERFFEIHVDSSLECCEARDPKGLYARASGRDRRFSQGFCIEQTPWYGLGIDILNTLYPEARYIHMVRDGRDVAISFARTPWWHKDIGLNLSRWATELNMIRTSCALMLPPERVLTVRYEDFVQAPEGELRRICDFLRIGYEPGMLAPDQAIDYASFMKADLGDISSPALKTWSQSKPSSVFKGSAGAWKAYRDFDFSQLPPDVRACLDSFDYVT